MKHESKIVVALLVVLMTVERNLTAHVVDNPVPPPAPEIPPPSPQQIERQRQMLVNQFRSLRQEADRLTSQLEAANLALARLVAKIQECKDSNMAAPDLEIQRKSELAARDAIKQSLATANAQLTEFKATYNLAALGIKDEVRNPKVATGNSEIAPGADVHQPILGFSLRDHYFCCNSNREAFIDSYAIMYRLLSLLSLLKYMDIVHLGNAVNWDVSTRCQITT